MKDFLKKVVWVVVFVAILFVAYQYMPEYPHNYIKSVFQPKIDEMAASRINQVKALTNKDVDNKSYDDIFKAHTNTGCWVYEAVTDSKDGAEHVYYYGKDAAVNLKDYPDYGGQMYTAAAIKVDFKITSGNVDIFIYIDDFSEDAVLWINDGKHVKENSKIKADFFKQLYSGMRSEG